MTASPAPKTDPRSAPKRITARAVEGQELALVGVVAVLWLVLGLGTDTFFSGANLHNILFSMSPVAIIGVGMTAVIVTAGIDVSVGSTLVVVAVVVGKLLRDAQWAAPGALLVALLLGALLGLANGVLTAYGRVHPIIITFGTLNLYRFLAYRVFDGEQVDGVPPSLAFLGGGAPGTLAGLPTAFLLAVVLAALAWVYMRYVPTGRHLYAIGGNAEGARLAGIGVTRRLVGVYLVTGLLVGLAACVTVGSAGTVQQNFGVGLELQVIAAVVIGGTSILGGRGTVLGTMLGALLVATVTSAVTLLGWRSDLTELFIGLFIVVAVGVDLLRERRRRSL